MRSAWQNAGCSAQRVANQLVAQMNATMNETAHRSMAGKCRAEITAHRAKIIDHHATTTNHHNATMTKIIIVTITVHHDAATTATTIGRHSAITAEVIIDLHNAIIADPHRALTIDRHRDDGDVRRRPNTIVHQYAECDRHPVIGNGRHNVDVQNRLHHGDTIPREDGISIHMISTMNNVARTNTISEVAMADGTLVREAAIAAKQNNGRIKIRGT